MIDPSQHPLLIEGLRRALAATAAKTGGWAYYAGKVSRIEPTCWALLALASTSNESRDAWRASADSHLQFLARCQRPDGLLADVQSSPNLGFNGLAALVALDTGGSICDAILGRLIPAIVRMKGVSVTNTGRAADALQGWPWIENTFSWVEPTALCMLALKRWKHRRQDAASDERIHEAENVLLTRSCVAGGWNYGNANVNDQDLRPYVPTTALALMALQDRRTDPIVVRSLAYLQKSQANERSGMALALTALCLRLYGLPGDEVERGLADDFARVQRLENLHIVGMLLYALSWERHGATAFTL